eukprot:6180321-Pleurochrysis_carterae.AAC.1
MVDGVMCGRASRQTVVAAKDGYVSERKLFAATSGGYAELRLHVGAGERKSWQRVSAEAASSPHLVRPQMSNPVRRWIRKGVRPAGVTALPCKAYASVRVGARVRSNAP